MGQLVQLVLEIPKIDDLAKFVHETLQLWFHLDRRNDEILEHALHKGGHRAD